MNVKINKNNFLKWIHKKFDNINITQTEIQVNDIWWKNELGLPDKEQKCWININKNCYNAFKSERSGNIIEFVMEIEHCDWDEAIDILQINDYENIEEKITKLLFEEQPNNKIILQKKNVTLPENTYLIPTIENTVPVASQAASYLRGRKINYENLYICLKGDYKNRILIPYYGKNKELIFYNTRALFKYQDPKYLVAKKETFNVGKEDVLWMSNYPEYRSEIFLTEGEFDAIVLFYCGFNSAAFGSKNISDKQLKFLKGYHLTFAFDNDKAGKKCIDLAKNIYKTKRLIFDLSQISFVRPPVNIKDWNEFYVQHDAKSIINYINKEKKIINDINCQLELSVI